MAALSTAQGRHPRPAEGSRRGHARLVQKHGIDAGDGPADIVAAGKVPSDHFIGDRQESTVWALRAFDARLFADAAYPLVGACGCVAGLPCFPALESTRIHVLAPPKKRAEECDLFVRRGELMDETGTLLHRSHRLGPCGDDVIVRTRRSTDQSSAS